MKFSDRLKNLRFVLLTPTFVFLIAPVTGFWLSPRATHTAATEHTGWLSISLFGIFFTVLATLALIEYRHTRAEPRIRRIFIAAVLAQIAVSIFMVSLPGFGTLYWDSYHVVRMTSETVLVDWRSLFFEALVFYLLQLWDHVYTVSLFGAGLFALALCIPILWCRDWKRAAAIGLLVTACALSPLFLTYSTALFSDTFFASFSILSIYALIAVSQRFRQSNATGDSRSQRITAAVLFLLTAIAAVQLRHNGAVLAVFLMAAALVLVRPRVAAVSLACALLTLMIGFGQLKNSKYFPDANRDALLTNRNFQKIALVLNVWGAMLTAPEGYKTPSREHDLQQLSYFIDPAVLMDNFDSSNPIPVWQRFASPWRQISNEKTDAFVRLTIDRTLQNPSIVLRDRIHFLTTLANEFDISPQRIEKKCSLQRSDCPSFGDHARSHYYYSQIQSATLPWPKRLDELAGRYIQHQGAVVWLGVSLAWFVVLVFRPANTWWRPWIGLYGIAMSVALAIVIPAPEFRYFFPIISLLPASMAVLLSGTLNRKNLKGHL